MSSWRKAVLEALLKLPLEAFSREQREEIMDILVHSAWSHKTRPNPEDLLAHSKLVLSLMIRLMRRPTYYKVRRCRLSWMLMLTVTRIWRFPT
jgi:hypothetical protein